MLQLLVAACLLPQQVDSRRASGVESKIDQLHALLKKRFETANDGKFGITRLPKFRYLHPVDKNQQNAAGAFGPLATIEERNLVQSLRQDGLLIDFYTVSRAGTVRGPIDSTFMPNDSKLKPPMKSLGLKVLNPKEKDSQSDQVENVTLRAKAIFATSKECSNCHKDVKMGDRIGALIYVSKKG